MFVPACVWTAEFSSQVRLSVCGHIGSVAAYPENPPSLSEVVGNEVWALHIRAANLPPVLWSEQVTYGRKSGTSGESSSCDEKGKLGFKS